MKHRIMTSHSKLMVHDIMQLCFLMQQTYAPYPKWFGTAYSRLACAPHLSPLLHEVLAAPTWPEREIPLCAAYEFVAQMHNDLGITEPLATAVSYFHERPYRVINADRFTIALKNAIASETVKSIPSDIGSIDQFSHSTDLRENPKLRQRLTLLYT